MTRALRIGLLAPAAAPVHASATGSIESLVATLADGLAARGHEPTLFAVGRSATSARLHTTLPRGYDEDDDWWDWQLVEAAHVALAYGAADGLDLMHVHTPYALPAAAAASFPTVITHHTEIAPELAAAHAGLPGVTAVCASASQARALGPPSEIVPHGIDVEAMPFGGRSDGPLVFLGRLLADKGVAAAVRLAERCGRELVIAGARCEDGEEDGLVDLLAEPHVDYVGTLSVSERNALLAGACALVYPLLYEEPFGLVLIEAMACGTPVLALDVGAVSEIVEPGVTGWVADTLAGLEQGFAATIALDRAAVRRRALERFTAERMVAGYERVYRDALAGVAGLAARSVA